MTTETMTVYKGLVELKLLNDRISKAIGQANFCTSAQESADKVAGLKRAEFETAAKASFDQCNGLINRRNAIKRAIVRSNAITTIKVGDEEMTVAEAIDQKATAHPISKCSGYGWIHSTKLPLRTRKSRMQHSKTAPNNSLSICTGRRRARLVLRRSQKQRFVYQAQHLRCC